MKPPGIRSRILVVALLPALLVAVLVTALLANEQSRQAHWDQHRRLEALARQLSLSLEYTLFVGDHDRLQRLLATALSERDILAAAVLDPYGRLLAKTPQETSLPEAAQASAGFQMPILDEPLEHWHSIPITPTHHDEADTIYSSPEQQPAALGRLLLRVSNQSLNDELHNNAYKVAILILATLLFGILLAWALSRRLISTLGSIQEVVANIGRGQTHLRVGDSGRDELGRLADDINTMAAAVTATQEDLARRIAAATDSLRRERDAAEAASQARSRFFATASHDFRQPMQALGLFVARLEADVAGDVLQPRVRKIVDAVKHLQRLLDTLLDYSRLDGKVYRVERQAVNSAQAIQHVLDIFSESARIKGLQLRSRVVASWLTSDPALLHRILLNLVSNAVRYTRRGGILVTCRRSCGWAHIDVWDTGPGIPAELQDSIFDELVQLENPERDANKGLGLGLAIVRRTAELLEHQLQLCSRVGQGSRFRLTIPLAPAPQPETPFVDLAKPATQIDEARLLLICHNPGQSTQLNQMISGWGCTVTIMENIGETSDWITACGQPDLLLWDTQGGTAEVESALALLDRLAMTTGYLIPAILIANGPIPDLELSAGGAQRLLLVRPFRPARLRALLMGALISPGRQEA